MAKKKIKGFENPKEETHEIEKPQENKIKQIIELYYFDSPDDCKNDFQTNKTVGFERFEDGKLTYQSGQKTAYCIKMKK